MKSIMLLGFMLLSNAIDSEHHQLYVDDVGVGFFITIVLICLVTDIINFYKTLVK